MAEQLRCKPGDLAVVIRGGAAGSFVTIVERSSAFAEELLGEPAWRCELATPREIVNAWGVSVIGTKVNVADSSLLPIRPDASLLDKSVVQPLASPISRTGVLS